MNVKNIRSLVSLGVCLAIAFGWLAFLPQATAVAEENEITDLSRNVYADSLASGWRNFSWGTVNLGNTSPVHSGTKSIRAKLENFSGLYLYYPGFFPDGYNKINFFIHGGTAGGQQLDLHLTFNQRGTDVDGTRVAIPAPQANQWKEVTILLSDLGVSDLSITGIVIQDASGGTQGAFYLDDISMISDTDAAAPSITLPAVQPRAVRADGETKVTVSAKIVDPQGSGDIAEVFIDGSAFGLGQIQMYDTGLYFDGGAGDGRYGAVFTINRGRPAGEYVVAIHARDKADHLAIKQAGALAVLSQPGGSIPAGLPNRIGWGSNAWVNTAGSDWQGESGVPWDYNYAYITYDWYTGGYEPNYIGDFVTQAWNRDEIPVIAVYIMPGLAACGESGDCYAGALQDSSKVATYIAAVKKAVQEASGSLPVVFNIEPDFIGFMQQYTNSPDRPGGVQPDDPGSVPVDLNKPGYGNNLAGFGQYIVHLIQTTADNALAAPMVSWWGTEDDPFAAPPERVIANAQRMANFTLQMGGDEADLLIVQWGDSDAGSGQSPFWDLTNNSLPRATRANLWNNALSASSGKRLMIWELPAGNMDLDDTPQHYRDNRAEYVFSHPRDLIDSGVIGVMFGGGSDNMTQVWTDGDFIKSQGEIAYAVPAVPGGFSLVAVDGALVTLRWDPNSEPDMWGYLLEYQPAGSGTPVELNVGRANSARILIPRAGDYTVRIRAYDAMNKKSDFSGSISFTTTEDAPRIFLPAVMLKGP